MWLMSFKRTGHLAATFLLFFGSSQVLEKWFVVFGRCSRRGETLSSPFGLADHQWRHLLRSGPSIGYVGTASITRIPVNFKQLDSQRQLVFLQFAEHR